MRLDGNQERLSVVSSVAVGPGNRLALWSSQDRRITVYDADGSLLGSIGRAGQGPGEFSNSVPGFHWIGDSVWAYDLLLSRENVITADGRLVRARAIPKLWASMPDQGIAETFAFTPQMRLTDGSAVGLAIIARADKPQWVDRRAVLRVTDDTLARLLVVVPPADDRWEESFAYLPRVVYSPASGRFAHAQVNGMQGRDGEIVVSVLRAPEGDTAAIATFKYLGVRMPTSVVDSIERTRRARDPDGRPLPQLPLDRTRVPPVYVPLRDLILGSDGRIWLVVRESPSTFRVVAISERNVPGPWFQLPRNARVMAASSTHVWLREEDADGVQSIVRYRFGN